MKTTTVFVFRLLLFLSCQSGKLARAPDYWCHNSVSVRNASTASAVICLLRATRWLITLTTLSAARNTRPVFGVPDVACLRQNDVIYFNLFGARRGALRCEVLRQLQHHFLHQRWQTPIVLDAYAFVIQSRMSHIIQTLHAVRSGPVCILAGGIFLAAALPSGYRN